MIDLQTLLDLHESLITLFAYTLMDVGIQMRSRALLAILLSNFSGWGEADS